MIIYHGTSERAWKGLGRWKRKRGPSALYVVTDLGEAALYAVETAAADEGDGFPPKPIVMATSIELLKGLKFQPDWGWSEVTDASTWKESLKAVGSFSVVGDVESYKPRLKNVSERDWSTAYDRRMSGSRLSGVDDSKARRKADIETEWDALVRFMMYERPPAGSAAENRFVASAGIFEGTSVDDWLENKTANLIDEYSLLSGIDFEEAAKILVARPVHRVSLSARSLYYHVTPWKNLKSIQRLGLIPKTVKRGMYAHSDEPRVYFFTDRDTADDALTNWLADEYPASIRYVAILKVELESWSVTDDEELAGAVYTTQRIEPSRIVGVEKQDIGVE